MQYAASPKSQGKEVRPMKISNTIPNFYNAAAKINADADKVHAKKVQQMAGSASSGNSDSSQQRQSYVEDQNRRIIQTKVSPENSYQKTMLSDASFAMDRMAGKLMPSIERILRDMKDLSDIEIGDETEEFYKSKREASVQKFSDMKEKTETREEKTEKININI